MRVPDCHSERMRGIFPQAFSLSLGVRKLLNHFVVKVSSALWLRDSPRLSEFSLHLPIFASKTCLRIAQAKRSDR
jgi:hypothetical protein